MRAVALALLAALGGLVACGGRKGTLPLTVVVSPADDPFADAAHP